MNRLSHASSLRLVTSFKSGPVRRPPPIVWQLVQFCWKKSAASCPNASEKQKVRKAATRNKKRRLMAVLSLVHPHSFWKVVWMTATEPYLQELSFPTIGAGHFEAESSHRGGHKVSL